MSAYRRAAVPLWLLGLFTFSGPVGMHIFVPALPAAARDLQAPAGALQLTVSVYILGLAVGQLVYGPISDRFGRRPALFAGLTLFTLASIAGLFAPDARLLIAARFVQAFGGVSGLMLARAIIRDTTEGDDAARRLALMNLLVTAGPAAAPIIGAALSSFLGWRSIMMGLTALGVANLALAWRVLPETRPEAAHVGAATHVRDYLGLLRSRRFLCYAVGGGCATTSLYAFIACAPFVFANRLHVPEARVGLYLALLVSGLWLGSLLASRLISGFSLRGFLVMANALSVAGALGFLALAATDRMSVPGVVGAMFLFSLGIGGAAPAALTQAISLNPRVTGSAAGLYGAIQMAVGAILVALAGLGSNPALAAGLVLVLSGVVAQGAFWLSAREPGLAGTTADRAVAG
jgi:MFS transporter, DHA1 family, multidrug resistance protein